MKNQLKITTIIALFALFFGACSKDTVYTESKYDSSLSFPDSSATHPQQAVYQGIIDDYASQGLLGVSVAITDENGTWLGAGGKADIKSDIDLQVGHRFLIASISKVFTATAIYTYLDEGLLTLEDPVNKWIDQSITDKIENANDAQIQHLLGHRSGIRDWYTAREEADRYNEAFNNWTQEDLLEYVYGKSAVFAVGSDYQYSNTNYVLLGMILEKVAQKSLKEVYQSQIFTPLNLQSAYFDTQAAALNDNVVKGYQYIVGSGFVEAIDLYRDELSTGDGGISINAQDLNYFMNALMNGEIISESSLAAMQNWFPISENSGGGDLQNGYGLEYFENEYGDALGHTGGVDGFTSILYYYPDEKITVAFLFNYSPSSYSNFLLREEFLKEMETAIFEE